MKRQGKKLKNRIGRIMIFLCFLSINFLVMTGTVFAQEDPIQEAKNAVVEVYSGFTEDDGTFHRLKNASGFVISNNESQAYIITTYDTLKNSEKAKINYCKKNDISTEGYSLRDSVQVVVKGDVTVEATILTESEEDNYSILQVGGSISERTAMKLGNVENMMTGDRVYALGFPDDAGTAENPVEFTAGNVEVREGRMQDKEAEKNNVIHLQHSAVISKGNTGGPLLNQEGYVIGMNNAALNDEAPVVFYTLPIEEIRPVLDNFQIPYGSVENDAETEEFASLVKECKTLAEDSRYKSSSKAALQELLQSINNMDEKEFIDAANRNTLSEQLITAKDELQLKMKTTKKVIYVLAGVIVFLAIWLVRLFLWKKKAKNSEILDIGDDETTKLPERNNVQEAVESMESEEQEPEPEWIPGMPVEDNEEKTMILGASAVQEKEPEETNAFSHRKQKAIIKLLRTGTLTILDKPIITIGKHSENDMVISDNKAVSKRHAYLLWENNHYYIMDRGSANGTFVNGIQIEKNEKVKISNGDTIVLADEKMLFKTEE